MPMRPVILAAVLLAGAAGAAAELPDVPVIERTKLSGNPSRVAGRLSPDGRLLAWIAPRADAIRRPLLIGQGANDPRVNHAEADQIVRAMSAKGIPVTHVLFPDEGHGFARPENNIAFNAIAEQFLKACLGGRSEPIGAALIASGATVPHGAEYAPGLKAALAARPTPLGSGHVQGAPGL